VQVFRVAALPDPGLVALDLRDAIVGNGFQRILGAHRPLQLHRLRPAQRRRRRVHHRVAARALARIAQAQRDVLLQAQREVEQRRGVARFQFQLDLADRLAHRAALQLALVQHQFGPLAVGKLQHPRGAVDAAGKHRRDLLLQRLVGQPLEPRRSRARQFAHRRQVGHPFIDFRFPFVAAVQPALHLVAVLQCLHPAISVLPDPQRRTAPAEIQVGGIEIGRRHLVAHRCAGGIFLQEFMVAQRLGVCRVDQQFQFDFHRMGAAGGNGQYSQMAPAPVGVGQGGRPAANASSAPCHTAVTELRYSAGCLVLSPSRESK